MEFWRVRRTELCTGRAPPTGHEAGRGGEHLAMPRPPRRCPGNPVGAPGNPTRPMFPTHPAAFMPRLTPLTSPNPGYLVAPRRAPCCPGRPRRASPARAPTRRPVHSSSAAVLDATRHHSRVRHRSRRHSTRLILDSPTRVHH
jgi:hypothetical protein